MKRAASALAMVFAMGGLAYAQHSLLDGAHLEGMQLLHSKGDQLQEEIQSSESYVDEQGVSMMSHNVKMTILNGEAAQRIDVTSPLARYYYATPEGESADGQDALSPEEAEALAAAVKIDRSDKKSAGVIDAGRGDILLVDPAGGDGVFVNFGEKGSLRARELYWNEARQRFICPGPFRQEANVPEGRIVITGDCFVTDRTFSDWWYPTTGENPVQLEFEGPKS